jgi:hypothetical protein
MSEYRYIDRADSELVIYKDGDATRLEVNQGGYEVAAIELPEAWTERRKLADAIMAGVQMTPGEYLAVTRGGRAND